MKIIIYILLSLSSFEVLAEIFFGRKDDEKTISVKYIGNSKLTLSHNYDAFCEKSMVPAVIRKEVCTGGRAPYATLVTVNNSYLQGQVVIDMFDQNGSVPEITNITALDLDLDGSNELYIQVLSQPRNSGSGITPDTLELFSYSHIIEPQPDTGRDIKRLYYLEEEYKKLLISKEITFYGPLDITVLNETLLLIKQKMFTTHYLNKMGEYWYKKEKIYAESTVHWYGKNYSIVNNVAVSYFEAAIKKDPKYIPALSNLGIAYQKLGQYDKAIKAAMQAIELTSKPNQKASSHYNIAKAYEKKKNWLAALDNYKKAVSYREHKAYEKGIKRMNDLLTSGD